MLRLWPRELLISISRESFSISQRSSFLRKPLIKRDYNLSESQYGDWQGFATKLRHEIANFNVEPSTRLRVLVHSDAVNYLLLPPNHILMRDSDKLAYAQVAYCEVHGIEADTWQICCSDEPPNQPSLSAAIEPALLKTIQEIAKHHELYLSSIQPYLSAVLRRLRGKLAKVTTLVILEPARLLLVRLEQGVLLSVRVLRHGQNWSQTLIQVLHRDALLDPKLPKTLTLYAPEQQSTKIEALSDWEVQRVNLGGHSYLLEPIL